MARILIADHLAERRNILSTFLRSDEHSIIPVGRESEAVKAMREAHPDLIILEGTVGGARILSEAKGLDSEPAIIMLMASPPSAEQLVELMNQGVNEVLVSPLDITDVQTKTHRALLHRPVSTLLQLRFADLVGPSEKMQQVFRKIVKAAAADHPVFISGEPGAGKQSVARQIHELSSRKEREFRAAYCQGLTGAELESELFGHEPGVFPWAVEKRQGELELGDGGTLYLEEVSELSLLIQAKLLSYLEGQKLQRMGSGHRFSADVRLVAGSSESLVRKIEEGKFRADLFYRLSVCPIEVPPLRARVSDIPDLVYYFLSQYEVQIAPEAMEVLMNYSWPGSVEELKNAVEQGINSCENNRIELRDLPHRVLKAVALGGRKYKFTAPSKP
jgi:DNA-binding NtrC family response regulator